jgi:hypothetical protein
MTNTNEVRKFKELLEHTRLASHGQKVPPPSETEKEKLDAKAKREKELEESRKNFEKIYKEKQGKIPNDWPSSIFDY